MHVVDGDLFDTDAEVIVNPWNRNLWWSRWWLHPHGVSGQMLTRAGAAPFKELRRTGAMALGEARWTGPGELPLVGIVHVAGIDARWKASEASVRDSVRNAVAVATGRRVRSLALPVIGAGSGGLDPNIAQRCIEEAVDGLGVGPMQITLVRYRPQDAHPAPTR